MADRLLLFLSWFCYSYTAFSLAFRIQTWLRERKSRNVDQAWPAYKTELAKRGRKPLCEREP